MFLIPTMQYSPASFTRHVLAFSFVTLLLRQIYVAIHRLFFHPLSGFPGPWLAGITSLYKTYYDVFEGGEMLRKTHELHSIYGPVVRIGPNELHFNDYRAYHEIYSVESRFTKDPIFYSCFNTNDSTFGAIDHLQSKARRAVMHRFFSRQAVLSLEVSIRQKINQLVRRLASRGRTPSNIFLAYRTATLDIIIEYLFGYCQNNVNFLDFKAPLVIDIQTSVPLLWDLKCFPFIFPLLPYLPRWLAPRIYDQFQAFCSVQKFLFSSLDRSTMEAKAFPGAEYITVCHRLLGPSTQTTYNSSCKPAFLDEVFSLIQAGSDTVGNTCTVGTFYVLNDKRILLRLTEELRSVWTEREETIDLAILESLPYLTAVIKESLRLSHGFVTPLPRIVGPLGAKIAGFEIPSNTIVGMSVTAVHLNARLFPNPNSFVPERWLQPSSDLDRYLVPFSKGPRACLGMSMAWVELYLFFAYIFRKLDLEVVDSSDFTDFRDYFIPVYKGSHLHVRSRLVG